MSKQNMDDTNFTFRSLSHDEYKYTIFFNFHTNVLVVMDNYALYKPMYNFVAIISDRNKKINASYFEYRTITHSLLAS